MQIGCTKKLLDGLKLTEEPVDHTIDPLFFWYAGVEVKNRKKLIIVSNEATRFSFVLYGMTASKAKHPEEIIFEGIRRAFLDAKIAPTIIDRYLADLGTTVSFTKNRTTSAPSRMSRNFIDLNTNIGVIENDNLFQTDIAKFLNNIPVTIDRKNQYSFPVEELQKSLKEYYREETVCQEALLTLEVRLEGTQAVRILRVPNATSVYDFHRMIQNAFNWRDQNSHTFFSEGKEPLNVLFPNLHQYVDYDRFDASQYEMESRVTVEALFNKKKLMYYAYDFSTGWTHRIKLLRRDVLTEENPDYCIMAAGEAPPENIVSVEIFQKFLKILANPDDPQYDQYRRFAEANRWQPLNLSEINKALHWVLR